jgi:Nucleotidyl transferase AbiEii toxin, Type IV TA system
MSTFRDALEAIGQSFDELGRPWALVGALAVAARAEARATLDVDVAVAVESPEEALDVTEHLRSLGYRWKSDLGTFMTSFLIPGETEAGLRLDVLFSLTGIEAEVARRAGRIEILPGLQLPVASLGDLIALKLLSAGEPGREHDWRDLRALVARSNPEDLKITRSAIALLGVRGHGSANKLEARLVRLLET